MFCNSGRRAPTLLVCAALGAGLIGIVRVSAAESEPLAPTRRMIVGFARLGVELLREAIDRRDDQEARLARRPLAGGLAQGTGEWPHSGLVWKWSMQAVSGNPSGAHGEVLPWHHRLWLCCDVGELKDDRLRLHQTSEWDILLAKREEKTGDVVLPLTIANITVEHVDHALRPPTNGPGLKRLMRSQQWSDDHVKHRLALTDEELKLLKARRLDFSSPIRRDTDLARGIDKLRSNWLALMRRRQLYQPRDPNDAQVEIFTRALRRAWEASGSSPRRACRRTELGRR